MDVTKQRDLGGFYRHLWREENGIKQPATVSTSHAANVSGAVKIKTEPIESSRSKSDKLKDGQWAQPSNDDQQPVPSGRVKTEETNKPQATQPCVSI